MKVHYIYKITNKINGNYYIGKRSTTNKIEKDPYMGSGKLIRHAIEKYGIDNFDKEILAVFDTEDQALQCESELLDEEIINDPKCYNMKSGGIGGWDHINCLTPYDRPNIKQFLKLFEEGKINNPGGTHCWTNESWDKVRQTAKSNTEYVCNLYNVTNVAHISWVRDKIKEAHKRNEHQQGCKNSNYGKVWCVPYNANDLKICKSFDKNNIPPGWITTKDWKEQFKNKSASNYGKSWYNDGQQNFLLKKDDPKTSKLEKGRLMNWKKAE